MKLNHKYNIKNLVKWGRRRDKKVEREAKLKNIKEDEQIKNKRDD